MTYVPENSDNPIVSFVGVNSSLSPGEMLALSGTDYHVGLAFLAAAYPEGVDLRNGEHQRIYFHTRQRQPIGQETGQSDALPQSIPVESSSHLGTIATFPNGDRHSLGVVGSRYRVMQNSQVLAEALTVATQLGSSVRAVGRNPKATVFAVQFSSVREQIMTYDDRSEEFLRTLFAYSSHDGSYAYSYAFHITDPENRIIDRVIVKRKHTANITTDKALEKLLTAIAEASQDIIDDIRVLAVLRIRPPQLEAGLKVLAKKPLKRISETEIDDQQMETETTSSPNDTDSDEARIERIRMRYVTYHARYGATAWALYEAWIDVMMADDQREQREAFEKNDPGLILHYLTKRSASHMREYSRKRRQLLQTLIEKQ